MLAGKVQFVIALFGVFFVAGAAVAQCPDTLLTDGAFESGGIGWDQTTGSSGVVVFNDPANSVSGNWVAKFGNNTGTDTYSLSQTANAPAGYAAILRFYLWRSTVVTGDFFQVIVNGQVVFELNSDMAGYEDYAEVVLDVTVPNVLGSAPTILFFAQTRGLFLVDDVCLNVLPASCDHLEQFENSDSVSFTSFSSAGPLRQLFAGKVPGVSIYGDTPNSGGTVVWNATVFPRIKNASSFYSLGFDTSATYKGGGTPAGPQWFSFANPIDGFKVRAGTNDSPASGKFTLTSFDANGGVLQSLVTEMTAPGLAPAVLSVPGIKRVQVSFTSQTFAIDDICIQGDPGQDPCFANSVYSQMPSTSNYTAYLSELASEKRHLDHYSGAAGPFQRISFRGILTKLSQGDFCYFSGTPRFDVILFADNGGVPGAVVHQGTYVAANDIVKNSRTTSFGGVDQLEFEYFIQLSESVDLPTGWLSIANAGGPTCNFRWSASGDGDGIAGTMDLDNNFTASDKDVAFCLAPLDGDPSPTCDGPIFSQAPSLLWVNSAWGDLSADVTLSGANSNLIIDNFTATAPFDQVTFWGFPAGDGSVPCASSSANFQLWLWNTTPTTSTPDTVVPITPVITDTGYRLARSYFADTPVYQYMASLPAPIEMTSGYVAVVAIGDTACGFAWLQTREGDDIGYYGTINGSVQQIGSGLFSVPINKAICFTSSAIGEGEDGVQSADQDGNFVIVLAELLRVIQFYNSLGYHCADNPGDTEDGYVPGPGANQTCTPYDTDYNPQNWVISLPELLRIIQFYNSLGYHYCPADATEDGFCPGP